MARFDVYRNRSDPTPFLLDVQSELIDGLPTRVVVPLRLRSAMKTQKLPRLMPVLDVLGIPCILETPKLAAVRAHTLGIPVANLHHERDAIIAALDFLFQGW